MIGCPRWCCLLRMIPLLGHDSAPGSKTSGLSFARSPYVISVRRCNRPGDSNSGSSRHSIENLISLIIVDL